MLGPERPLLLSRDDRERIAYHEGGHAILGLVVPGADPVHRVSIVPRGQALGVTYQRPENDRYFHGLVIAEIDLDDLSNTDPSGWNLERDRRPDIYED